MNSMEEIREKYTPHVVETKGEFDDYMEAVNHAQREAVRPLEEQLKELNRQTLLIDTQMSALNIQKKTLIMQKIDIDSKRKEFNRAYHDLKHEMVMLNPKRNDKEDNENSE